MDYIVKKLLVFIIALFIFYASSPSFALDLGSKEELQRFILKTIRDHPQVLIDILRNNSEAVLDIAQEGSNQRRIHTLQKQWQKDLTEEKEVKITDRPILGNKDAKVRIAAFSDFTCYYCKASKSTLDTILKEFGDSVSLVFKSIPFDEKGPSAIASLWFLAIAEQDEEKAWEFYNTMFNERDKLQSEGEKFIRKVAKDLKLNMAKIESDVRNSKKIKTILKEDRDDADRLNIEGTPCFLVNNIVVRGALPLDLFRIAVKMALKNAER